MTTKEKTTLFKQAGKLYTLGLKVEKCRDKMRRLVEGKGALRFRSNADRTCGVSSRGR